LGVHHTNRFAKQSCLLKTNKHHSLLLQIYAF
jgi:hypothetical protein